VQNIFNIGKQTLWQLLARFISAFSGIIILGIIARNYGAIGVGDFSLALLFIIFFQTIADFGVNAHIVKKLHDSNSLIEWRKLLGARLIWSIILIILAGFITSILPFSPPTFGFSNDFKMVVFLGLVMIIFYAIKVTHLSLIQSKLKYQFDVIPVTVGSLLGLAAIVYMAYLKLPVYFLILGYVGSFFLQAIIPPIINSTLFKSFKPIFDLDFTKDLLIKTWPLSATLILNTIYFRIDVFLIGLFKGAADVGIYNIAFQFFQVALVLPTFIMNAVYPLMLKNSADKKRFYSQVKIAGWTLFFLSFSVTIATYLLSPYLVQLVAGNGFEGSVTVLQILSLGFPGFFITSLIMWLLVIKNKYKQIFVIYLLGLVFNLGLNIFLIPQYSYLGAAIVTVIAEYLILVLQLIVLKSLK
jgi:O-antigen/teichoic acid export membrane protein